MKPELARIFTTEIKDMAASLSSLHARLKGRAVASPCLSVEAEVAPTAPLREQLEALQRMTGAFLDALRDDARAEGPDASTQAMIAACGGIMKALSNTLDVMRSLPVESEARNRF